MSLTYSIQDIRDPDKRNTAYSKTIKIPGSKENNKLFTHIFDLSYDIQTSGTTNFVPDFNPNLKANVIVYVDSVIQFQGILKLDKITLKNNDRNNYTWDYECTMFGKVANIFASMGDQKLTDLNLSTYNHVYNKTNIKNSWTAPVGSGYVYPMIDYGYTNNTTYNVVNFYPAVYVKQYWDSIFQAAGFQYQSEFLTNSSIFKRLIVPFNSDKLKLTDTQILNRMFRSSASSNIDNVDTHSGVNAIVVFDNDTTSPNFDTTSNYSTVTGKFTAPNAGVYNFVVSMNITYDMEPNSPEFSPAAFWTHAELWRGNNTPVASSNIAQVIFGSTVWTAGQTTGDATLSINTQVYLSAGEDCYCRIVSQPVSTWTSVFPVAGGIINLRVKTGSYFFNNVINSGIYEGDTVAINNAIPLEVLQRDFIMGIVNMFNLYIEEDKNTPNKLIIEPYVDYYTSGSTVNWTNKLDLINPIEVQPMGALDAKRYRYKYKDDNDYYNAKYKRSFNETYGTKFTDITNDFIKNEKVNEVLFAPTPLVQMPTIDRIISTIKAIDDNGVSAPTQSVIRILYWGGSLATTNSWSFTSLTGTTTETTYPYAGHLDNPITPTFDICFGIPREVFYYIAQTDQYTDNNLYNKYYSAWIAEISDRNSKILTANFYLRPTDILALDFRNKIFVDGQYYRLNKIYDYNPIVTQTTKCELLRIKETVPFSPLPRKVYGGTISAGSFNGPVFNGGNIPSGGVAVSLPGGLPSNGRIRNISTGYSSVVSPLASNVIESGAYNYVGENCEMISIMNSSGIVVSGGVTNVSVMNSSGVTVVESGISIINNVQQKTQQAKIKRVTANYELTSSDEVLLVSGTSTIQITTPKVPELVGKTYEIKNIGTANVQLVTSTYDNSGTYTISSGTTGAYPSVRIMFESPANGYYIMPYFASSAASIADGDKGDITTSGSGATWTIDTNVIDAGVYTPTLTNVANLDGSTAYELQYMRVRATVTVSGKVDIDPTLAATSTKLGISLPIASTFGALEDCGGVAFAVAVATQGAAIIADTTNNRAQLQYVSGDINNRAMFFTFTYQII